MRPSRTDRLFPALDDLGNEVERELAALEPAWGKAALFFRTGHRLGHPPDSMRCMSLVEVHRLLGVYRSRAAAGDTLSLLQAISMCAEENLPLPQWLAEAFCMRMSAFGRPGKVYSLDEVFSSREMPTKSPKKGAGARLDWQLGSRLWRDVWDLVNDDETITSVDRAVERLLSANDYGVGKTKAKSVIAMIGASQSQFVGHDVALSSFLAKRRKLLT